MHDHMNTAKYCLISVDYQSLNLQLTRKYEKKDQLTKRLAKKQKQNKQTHIKNQKFKNNNINFIFGKFTLNGNNHLL